ncbi:DMT family transporter [Pyrococcus sp. ST04]|uniref:DMT family transporter n=1 Tax=Pyrococcus sp. ST04 TaxID=1183377 RepID=UPI0002605C48|nr:DMT family transporter [Pyrococcus sp. ST04]AFK22954.1 putative drug/metabolite transporter permease [Pyrococcus sp. ST04]
MNKYGILAVLLWSTVATAFKLTLSRIDPVSMLFYASLTSLLVFFFGILRSKSRDVFDFKVNLSSAVLGFLNPFLYYLVLFTAYDLLPAQEAQALNYTWPIFLTIFATIFLGQSLTYHSLLGILVSFTGALVVGTRGNLSSLKFVNPVGDGLALASALIWATYWILNLRDKRDSIVKMFWNFFFGVIYIGAFVVLRGIKIDILGIVGSIYIGLFEMGVTFFVWLKALESEEAKKVSSLIYLTPALSLCIISIVLGEKILISTIVGLSLIILGISIVQGESRI